MDLIQKFVKAKEDYEASLKALGEAMILVDKDNKIIYVNKDAEDQFGLTSGELIGKDWIEQSPGESLVGKIDETTRPSAVAVLAGQVKSSIFMLKHKESGESILTNVTATPILLNGYVAGGIVVLKRSDFLNKPSN